MDQQHQYHNVVVLTGAGVSAESGLKTFRDSGGLWEQERIEDVCTPEAFARDPERVHRFYNARRSQLVKEAKPNAAHIALADFEKRFSGAFTLITQNVDDLHEQAGSDNVVHMHGELRKARCLSCQTVSIWDDDIQRVSVCSSCRTAGALRPHIVWFGELPLYMEAIATALQKCDLFLSIGTSGQVYPAAGFVQLAHELGARCVEINLEPNEDDTVFDEHICGPAGVEVPRYLQTLI